MSTVWNAPFDELAATLIANARGDILARAQSAEQVTQMLLAIETTSQQFSDHPAFREQRTGLEFEARQKLAGKHTSRAERAEAIAVLCALSIIPHDN